MGVGVQLGTQYVSPKPARFREGVGLIVSCEMTGGYFNQYFNIVSRRFVCSGSSAPAERHGGGGGGVTTFSGFPRTSTP